MIVMGGIINSGIFMNPYVVEQIPYNCPAKLRGPSASRRMWDFDKFEAARHSSLYGASNFHSALSYHRPEV